MQLQTTTNTSDFTTPHGSTQPKVLLIEDDRSTRRMVKAEIDQHCNFIGGENMQHGLSQFNNHKPDLVFLDITLPDGCGHHMLECILTIKPESFVVMFSGSDDRDNVWGAVEAGAKGFIAKPFDAKKLLFFIDQCQQH